MKVAVRIDKKTLNGWIIVSIICGVIVASFYQPFFWMLKQWFVVEQYSPGALIPLMGIIILWHKLRKLKNPPKFSKDKLIRGGVIVIALAAAVYLCTEFMEEPFFSQLIVSYVVLFFGWIVLLLCYMGEAKELSNKGAAFIFLAFLFPVIAIIILWHPLKKLKNPPKFSKNQLIRGGVIVIALAAAVYLCTEFMEELLFSQIIVHFSYAVLFLGLTFLLLYCAILIMRDDETHMEQAKKLSNNIIGAAFICFALLFHFFAQRGDLHRISIIAYLGLLFGLMWFFGGKHTAVEMLFPLAFLLFMTPLEFLDDFIGGPLRILATTLSTFIMKMIGLNVSSVSPVVFEIKGMRYGVEEACSGLRSLIALSAIGATFAYVTQPTITRKYFIGLCALPIAVMTNVIRLVFVGIAAQFFGQKMAMRVHDNSIVLYVVAILLLFSLDKLFRIEWLKIENF